MDASNAIDVLKKAQESGIRISVAEDGAVCVTGDKGAVYAMLPQIRAHKDAIADALRRAECSTCEHVKPSGCCGEPVAAGLSTDVGVIRYREEQGCMAWRKRDTPSAPPPRTAGKKLDALREAYRARVAALCYDGGMTREAAETAAWEAVRQTVTLRDLAVAAMECYGYSDEDTHLLREVAKRDQESVRQALLADVPLRWYLLHGERIL